MEVLCRDGEPIAAVEVPRTLWARSRGLLGRDGIDGAMWLEPARSVHTFGMRFAIDVAFVDRAGVVRKVVRMAPGRLSPLVWRSRAVVEAEAGALTRWGIRPGVRLTTQPQR